MKSMGLCAEACGRACHMLHQAPMLPGAPLRARVLRLEQRLTVFERVVGYNMETVPQRRAREAREAGGRPQQLASLFCN